MCNFDVELNQDGSSDALIDAQKRSLCDQISSLVGFETQRLGRNQFRLTLVTDDGGEEFTYDLEQILQANEHGIKKISTASSGFIPESSDDESFSNLNSKEDTFLAAEDSEERHAFSLYEYLPNI